VGLRAGKEFEKKDNQQKVDKLLLSTRTPQIKSEKDDRFREGDRSEKDTFITKTNKECLRHPRAIKRKVRL
jgi:predicted transposase YbfD/YdcC